MEGKRKIQQVINKQLTTKKRQETRSLTLTKKIKNIILFKALNLVKKGKKVINIEKGGIGYGKNDTSTKEETKIKSSWF